MLTKTDFIKFIQCPKYLWLGKFKKDLAEPVDDEKQKLFGEGAEVEEYAYKLFPGGVFAGRVDDFKENIANTKKVMASGVEVIFQPTFSNYKTNLYCRADILKSDGKSGVWDIYEVKSSGEVKDIYYFDLAFQKICLEAEGLKIRKLFLIHLNKEYVRRGEIDPKKMLVAEDLTDEVLGVTEEVKRKIIEAQYVLEMKAEPKVKIIKQCTNPFECDFIDYCWKEIPEDSIYDVAGGLTEKQIETLLDAGIINLRDLPEDYLKKEKYRRHLVAVKTGKQRIDVEEIREELKKLKYPLYFLDYETYSPAVPRYNGYRPHQRIVFQYSLDVQDAPDRELQHFDFLSREPGDPSEKLAEELSKTIGPEGSVISWFINFESGCNREMGERYPKFRKFFEGVNGRMFDLMDIFKNGHYVDKGFGGSSSLKKVMPILIPSLSYKNLVIQEGGAASNSWPKLFDEKLPPVEREKLYNNMIDYCRLDTLAMVEILKKLHNV